MKKIKNIYILIIIFLLIIIGKLTFYILSPFRVYSLYENSRSIIWHAINGNEMSYRGLKIPIRKNWRPVEKGGKIELTNLFSVNNQISLQYEPVLPQAFISKSESGKNSFEEYVEGDCCLIMNIYSNNHDRVASIVYLKATKHKFIFSGDREHGKDFFKFIKEISRLNSIHLGNEVNNFMIKMYGDGASSTNQIRGMTKTERGTFSTNQLT